MSVTKLYSNDGKKVAVIYSPGYGAGWSSWCYKSEEERESMIFDADLAQAVLDGDREEIKRVANEKWPDEYKGGLCNVEIKWVEVGTRFEIYEYGGNESVCILEPFDVYVA